MYYYLEPSHSPGGSHVSVLFIVSVRRFLHEINHRYSSYNSCFRFCQVFSSFILLLFTKSLIVRRQLQYFLLYYLFHDRTDIEHLNDLYYPILRYIPTKTYLKELVVLLHIRTHQVIQVRRYIPKP